MLMSDNSSTEIKEGGSRRLWAICRAAERAEIARVLEEHRQNRTHAAMALGISRRTLLNKIKAYALTPQACREYLQPAQPAAQSPVLVAAN
jgi:transcriptional regulator with PAS, ATPase and Fis domain